MTAKCIRSSGREGTVGGLWGGVEVAGGGTGCWQALPSLGIGSFKKG